MSREASSHYVTVAGLRLHHLDWKGGSGRTLILLPGGNLSAHSFGPLVSRLHGAYRCLGLDHRGHGGSDWSDALEYRVEHFAEDLAGWLAAMALNDVVLVGHSLGGVVALLHAAGGAQQVAGLVLLDIVPAVDPQGGHELARAVGALPVELGLDRHRFFESLDDLVDLAHSRAPERDTDVLRKQLAARTRVAPDGTVTWRHDPRRYRPGVHDGPRDLARFSSLASRVSCPTLLVRGEKSRILSDGRARAFMSNLPDGHLAVVPGAGHLLHEEEPDEVAAVLEAFIEQLS